MKYRLMVWSLFFNVISMSLYASEYTEEQFLDLAVSNSAILHLIDKGQDINSLQNQDGEKLIHKAAIAGNITTMRTLLDNGANIDEKGYMTPLLETVWRFNTDAVKFLLDRGADRSIPGGPFGGKTPLGLVNYLLNPKHYKLTTHQRIELLKIKELLES